MIIKYNCAKLNLYKSKGDKLVMEKSFSSLNVITAMVTAFDSDEKVNYEKTVNLACHLIKNGSDAIIAAGTTGESPTLTHDEELNLLKELKQSIGDKTSIIMGAGSNSTKTAIEMSQKMQANGADALLSVVPYYNKPSQNGIYEHFASIAKCVDIPIILYNIPGRTGVNIQPQTVAKLAGEFKNIKALKQSSPDMDYISELKELVDKDFTIFCGDDSLILPMMSLGATGVISVASHIVGNKLQQMIKEFKLGNINKALEIHLSLFPLFKKLFMAPNPVPVKEALSKMGLIENVLRQPLTKMNDCELKEFYSVAEKYID